MLVKEIITEALRWDSQWDQEMFMTLKGLVNKNNGVWKSKKQRDFVMAKKVGDRLRKDGKAMSWFGMDDKGGNGYILIDAIAQWANYGSRSQIPVRYGFVMDDAGVVSFWKIGNKGNLRQGSAPDPSKTKMEWKREGTPDVSHLEDTEEEKEEKFRQEMGFVDGEHLGNPGDKKFEFGEVELQASKTSQGYYGITTWHLFKDVNGNLITYTGKDLGLERGQKVNLTGTIKKHFENNKKQAVTQVIRPKVS